MFDFPKTTYKKFDKNFLKSVIFQISFLKNPNIIKEVPKIESIFKDEFPRFTTSKAKSIEISFVAGAKSPKEASVNHSDVGDVLLLRSIDGQKSINITQDTFTLTINGSIYESFRQIKELFVNIQEFLNICKISSVIKVAIRKINIIEFHLISSQNATDILARLLNSNLIGNINHFPQTENIKHNMQSLNYKNDDSYLNLKYGLNIPNKDLGQIIIDIDMVSTVETEHQNIEAVALKINEEIFNIFNWVLSEEAVSILN